MALIPLCRLMSAVVSVSRALRFLDTVTFSVPGLPKACLVVINSLVGREVSVYETRRARCCLVIIVQQNVSRRHVEPGFDSSSKFLNSFCLLLMINSHLKYQVSVAGGGTVDAATDCGGGCGFVSCTVAVPEELSSVVSD